MPWMGYTRSLYSPDQPRTPKGSPEGGRWVKEASYLDRSRMRDVSGPVGPYGEVGVKDRLGRPTGSTVVERSDAHIEVSNKFMEHFNTEWNKHTQLKSSGWIENANTSMTTYHNLGILLEKASALEAQLGREHPEVKAAYKAWDDYSNWRSAPTTTLIKDHDVTYPFKLRDVLPDPALYKAYENIKIGGVSLGDVPVGLNELSMHSGTYGVFSYQGGKPSIDIPVENEAYKLMSAAERYEWVRGVLLHERQHALDYFDKRASLEFGADSVKVRSRMTESELLRQPNIVLPTISPKNDRYDSQFDWSGPRPKWFLDNIHRRNNYSPEQPRDERGRWIDWGGARSVKLPLAELGIKEALFSSRLSDADRKKVRDWLANNKREDVHIPIPAPHVLDVHHYSDGATHDPFRYSKKDYGRVNRGEMYAQFDHNQMAFTDDAKEANPGLRGAMVVLREEGDNVVRFDEASKTFILYATSREAAKQALAPYLYPSPTQYNTISWQSKMLMETGVMPSPLNPSGYLRELSADGIREKKNFANVPNGTYKLGDFLDHPDLYRVHPDLRSLPVIIGNMRSSGGVAGHMQRSVWSDGRTTIDHIALFKGEYVSDLGSRMHVILHETQHAVDAKEGRTPVEYMADLGARRDADRVNKVNPPFWWGGLYPKNGTRPSNQYLGWPNSGGWRTNYDPSQPRDEYGRWIDVGGWGKNYFGTDSEEVKRRSQYAPFVELENGRVELGLPQFLQDRLDALGRIPELVSRGYDTSWDDARKQQAVEDIAAVVSTLLFGGVPKGALGAGLPNREAIAARVIALRKEGVKLEAIAAELGVSYPTVQRMVAAAGVPGPGRGPRPLLSAAQEAALIAERLQGALYKELAHKYGVSFETARNIVHGRRGKWRSRNNYALDQPRAPAGTSTGGQWIGKEATFVDRARVTDSWMASKSAPPVLSYGVGGKKVVELSDIAATVDSRVVNALRSGKELVLPLREALKHPDLYALYEAHKIDGIALGDVPVSVGFVPGNVAAVYYYQLPGYSGGAIVMNSVAFEEEKGSSRAEFVRYVRGTLLHEVQHALDYFDKRHPYEQTADTAMVRSLLPQTELNRSPPHAVEQLLPENDSYASGRSEWLRGVVSHVRGRNR